MINKPLPVKAIEGDDERSYLIVNDEHGRKPTIDCSRLGLVQLEKKED